ncbi:hypothetical protein TRFO_11640 [Tritrichomonas foetus]|uniref:IBB domain-containing protein n=1 Tax=Tritrichomonas foetus TaxID=1144522 RepID=A0A1J4J8B3_9EUKA|nr:hypothetical protein TRFO_11640 [Tritrichomonas foetus]|eukprot:OHS93645.1 hypothetical protein TRFO_11640 [Tritrichomonas foetus]
MFFLFSLKKSNAKTPKMMMISPFFADDQPDSLKKSGADLSNYREQCLKERNARTLTLRRNSRTAITNILGVNSLNSAGKAHRRASFLDELQGINLTIETIAEILESGSLQRISDLCTQIVNVSSTSPQLLQKLFQDPSIAIPFVNCFTCGINESEMRLLIDAISSIFPICNEDLRRSFIDEGLLMNIYCFFESEYKPIIYSSLALVAIVSISSSYARDSVLSLGILDSIIQLAHSHEEDKPLTDAACATIEKIFSDGESDINCDTLDYYLDQIGSLLKLTSEGAVNSILLSLNSMMEKSPSLVMKMNQIGLYVNVVNYLKIPSFAGAAIKIVGNLCIGNPSDVHMMLECGLFQLLIGYLRTEYVADVLWDLSNLLEAMTKDVLPMLTDDLINAIVEITSMSSYLVKREGAVFLSTLILYTDSSVVPAFVNVDIIEILVEMLGCSVTSVIWRCINSLMKLSHNLQPDKLELFIQMLFDADIVKMLNDLVENNNTEIAEISRVMLNSLSHYSKC